MNKIYYTFLIAIIFNLSAFANDPMLESYIYQLDDQSVKDYLEGDCQGDKTIGFEDENLEIGCKNLLGKYEKASFKFKDNYLYSIEITDDCDEELDWKKKEEPDTGKCSYQKSLN